MLYENEILKSSVTNEYYLQRLRSMSSIEKLERVGRFWKFAVNMISLQVKKANPDITERQVRILVAKRFYASDPETQRLLNLMAKEEGIDVPR